MAGLILRVNVTQEHINNAIRMSSTFCPIALALREKTGKRAYVTGIVELVNGESEYYSISERANRFIVRFDEGLEVKPATFGFVKRGTP